MRCAVCLTMALATVLALGLPASAQDTLWQRWGNAALDGFGCSVAIAGDVNGDGVDDIIASALQSSGVGFGYALVLSGVDGSILRTLYSGGMYDNFGWSVSGAGDVNGDGRADLIVGAPTDATVGSNAGMAWVFSGLNGGVLHTFFGEYDDDEFGFSVSSGDVDGDAVPDIIVGAPQRFGRARGYVRVYSGKTGLLIRSFMGEALGDEFGFSVCEAGKLDRDSSCEIIVGAPTKMVYGVNSGAAYVYSGKTGSLLYKFYGDSELSQLGFSVHNAGRVDPDGRDDFMIGAPIRAVSGDPGYVLVYSGASGNLLYYLEGEHTDDLFGYALCEAGDVNRDGWGDLLIGAPADPTAGVSAGAARLVSGKTGQTLYTLHGEEAMEWFGRTLAGGSKLNGDPMPDLVIAGPGSTAPIGWAYAGRVLAASGNDMFLQATPSKVWNGGTFRLTSLEGLGGMPLLLAIVDVSSTPVFFPVTIGFFDWLGRWQIDLTVPWSYWATSDITFKTFTYNSNGVVIDSGNEVVHVNP